VGEVSEAEAVTVVEVTEEATQVSVTIGKQTSVSVEAVVNFPMTGKGETEEEEEVTEEEIVTGEEVVTGTREETETMAETETETMAETETETETAAETAIAEMTEVEIDRETEMAVEIDRETEMAVETDGIDPGIGIRCFDGFNEHTHFVKWSQFIANGVI